MERMTEEFRNVKSIGYFIQTPFWSQSIGKEAGRQIGGIAFCEWLWIASSARVLEETRTVAVVKGGKAMDVRVYGYESCSKDMNRP